MTRDSASKGSRILKKHNAKIQKQFNRLRSQKNQPIHFTGAKEKVKADPGVELVTEQFDMIDTRKTWIESSHATHEFSGKGGKISSYLLLVHIQPLGNLLPDRRPAWVNLVTGRPRA